MRADRHQESVVEADELIWTFQFTRGAGSTYAGIYVARAAGLPPRILQRAREKAEQFETHCRMHNRAQRVSVGSGSLR